MPIILPAYTDYGDGKDSAPKRRHLQFRRRRITQKKEHNVSVLIHEL